MFKRFVAVMGVVMMLMQLAVPVFAAAPSDNAPAPEQDVYAGEPAIVEAADDAEGGIVPAAVDGYLSTPTDITALPSSEPASGIEVSFAYPLGLPQADGSMPVKEYTFRFYPATASDLPVLSKTIGNESHTRIFFPMDQIFDGDYTMTTGVSYQVTMQAHHVDGAAYDSGESFKSAPALPAPAREEASIIIRSDLLVGGTPVPSASDPTTVPLSQIVEENLTVTPGATTWEDLGWSVGDSSMLEVDEEAGVLRVKKLGAAGLYVSHQGETQELKVYVSDPVADSTQTTITGIPETGLEPGGKGVQLEYTKASGVALFNVTWGLTDTTNFTITRSGYLRARSDAVNTNPTRVTLSYSYRAIGESYIKDGGYAETTEIAVTPTEVVAGVVMNETAKTITYRNVYKNPGVPGEYPGAYKVESSTLSATLIPALATSSDVEWSAAPSGMLDFDGSTKGKLMVGILPKKAGTATVTVKVPVPGSTGKFYTASTKLTIRRGVDDGSLEIVPLTIDSLAIGKTTKFAVRFRDITDPTGKKTYTPTDKSVSFKDEKSLLEFDGSTATAVIMNGVNTFNPEDEGGTDVRVVATSADGAVQSAPFTGLKVYQSYNALTSETGKLYIPKTTGTDLVWVDLPIAPDPFYVNVTKDMRDFTMSYGKKGIITCEAVTVEDAPNRFGGRGTYQKWRVKGDETGTTTITLLNEKSGRKITFSVEVVDTKLLDSIKFKGNPSAPIPLKSGQTIDLTKKHVEFVAEGSGSSKMQTMQWTSENEEIATVSSSGVVRGYYYGQTTITGRAMNPKTGEFGIPEDKFQLTFTVKVSKDLTGANLYNSSEKKVTSVTVSPDLSFTGGPVAEPGVELLTVVPAPLGANIATATELSYPERIIPGVEVVRQTEAEKSVAVVEWDGAKVRVIAGQKPGTITAKLIVGTTYDEGKTKTISLKVTNKRYVTSDADILNYNAMRSSVVAIGKTVKLSLTPKAGFVKPKVVWGSKESNFLTVNRTSGAVKGLGNTSGSGAMVRAYLYAPGAAAPYAEIDYTVEVMTARKVKNTAAKAVKISESSFSVQAAPADITLHAGTSGHSAVYLSNGMTAENYTAQYVYWSSDKPESIDFKDGGPRQGPEVTFRVKEGAVPGKVTITARDILSGKSSKITITLLGRALKYATGITLSGPKGGLMNAGSSYKAAARFVGGPGNKNLNWSLEWADPAKITAGQVVTEYASVAPDGTVKALRSTQGISDVKLVGAQIGAPGSAAKGSVSFAIRQLPAGISVTNGGKNYVTWTADNTGDVTLTYALGPVGADKVDADQTEVTWKTSNKNVAALLEKDSGVASIKTKSGLSGTITLRKGAAASGKAVITGTAAGGATTTIVAYIGTSMPTKLSIYRTSADEPLGANVKTGLQGGRSYTFKALLEGTPLDANNKPLKANPADVKWSAVYVSNGQPVDSALLTVNADKGTVKWNAAGSSPGIRLIATYAADYTVKSSTIIYFTPGATKVEMLQSSVTTYAGAPAITVKAHMLREDTDLSWPMEWSSDDPGKARVDTATTAVNLYTKEYSVKVSPLASTGSGTVTIRVTDPVSGKSASFKMKILDSKPTQPESISLNLNALALAPGKSQKLVAQAFDAEGNVMKGQPITWTVYRDGALRTEYTKALTVSSSGVVKAVAPTPSGSTYVVQAALSNNPDVYTRCEVVVGEKLSKISSAEKTYSYWLGGVGFTGVEIQTQPAEEMGYVSVSDPVVTFSNPEIATFTIEDGDPNNYHKGNFTIKFKGVKAGKTKVTVKRDGKSCTFELVVA